jgi:hypothetical protein
MVEAARLKFTCIPFFRVTHSTSMGGLLTKTAKVGPNESDHTPQAPEKTHLGDTAALKRALDDAAIEVSSDLDD